VFRAHFPFAGAPQSGSQLITPLTSFVLLSLHYRMVHTLLVGAAGSYGTSFGVEHALRVVRGFARAVEHNRDFGEQLLKYGGTAEPWQIDGMALVLRD
jgi:lysine-N-methylase